MKSFLLEFLRVLTSKPLLGLASLAWGLFCGIRIGGAAGFLAGVAGGAVIGAAFAVHDHIRGRT